MALTKSEEVVSQAETVVEQAVAKAMSQLQTTINNYKGKFEPTNLTAYKHGLFRFMDKHLEMEVEEMRTSLGTVYEKAQKELIGECKYVRFPSIRHILLLDHYQALLQLENKELAEISQLVR